MHGPIGSVRYHRAGRLESEQVIHCGQHVLWINGPSGREGSLIVGGTDNLARANTCSKKQAPIRASPMLATAPSDIRYGWRPAVLTDDHDQRFTQQSALVHVVQESRQNLVEYWT